MVGVTAAETDTETLRPFSAAFDHIGRLFNPASPIACTPKFAAVCAADWSASATWIETAALDVELA
jgi:hypothetical protein